MFHLPLLHRNSMWYHWDLRLCHRRIIIDLRHDTVQAAAFALHEVNQVDVVIGHRLTQAHAPRNLGKKPGTHLSGILSGEKGCK